MFRSVLVANRGEIALRVMKTARRMGMRSIAVHSEADAGAPHVRFADAAHLIGPPPALESYLKIDRIIEASVRSGAEAIHPGYGFLSENAAFAEACAEAGIVFIGPPADAIRRMGNKSAAKALMDAAGVPVVPGYHGADQDDAVLALAAEHAGYPVLIKAAAGGGGKGMRRVNDPAAFDKELKAARREAMSAFGDDAMLVEKFVARPRHIEIQVFADSHGQAVHLFERECSIQRRHQKVIEEAPAPGMTEELRARMGGAAVAAARAIGYRGAGTVEFIVDGSQGLANADFFFMEMNTRLQVEHPVTEMITGTDLVEWQFRVAAGEALPLSQDRLSINGHAIEARLYAENPAKKFFPQAGPLKRLRFPPESPHLRIDSGVEEGQDISIYYDPMIAKVVAWDTTRAGAARRLETALQQTRLAGIASNLGFLAAIAGNGAFLAGDLHTGFIDEHAADLIPAAAPADREALGAAVLSILSARTQNAADPWDERTAWRVNLPPREIFVLQDGDAERRVTVTHAPSLILEINGDSLLAAFEREANGDLAISLGGVRATVHVFTEGETITVLRKGHAHRLALLQADAAGDDAAAGASDIRAPLPGRVAQVLAEPGKAVAKHAPLVILEAMKMEHVLVAPVAGMVDEVRVTAGDQVAEGAVLVTFAARS
ncbi:biotin carboxylase N-terminal domain-containing protein [Iodidimonas sp. SYSU 1G8]|uniref:acetyl/propionyl/methylcrotonyl-CoA carboxylase subunit alpha n=1 Tax=Iodidimonas sp. SYSU 1G8 TaxID=3133967 RepID=UPI0031FE968C